MVEDNLPNEPLVPVTLIPLRLLRVEQIPTRYASLSANYHRSAELTHSKVYAAFIRTFAAPVPLNEPESGRTGGVQKMHGVVMCAMAGAGVGLGALWVYLAPPVNTVIGLTRSGQRVRTYAAAQADQIFVAPAMFAGLCAIFAVMTAVLVWRCRVYRGPVMVVALWIGALLAASTAAATAVVLAHWRYGAVDTTTMVIPQDSVRYLVEAPPVFFGPGIVHSAVTLVLPAAIAALVYAILAVAATRDDLGGWPAIEETSSRWT